MTTVTRLNHAVLYVSDVARSLDFYEKAFGFKVVDRLGDQAVFLRAANTENHHDLALMNRRESTPAGGTIRRALSPGVAGATIEDMAEMATKLTELNALTGMSDHGVSKSLYAKDPDGIEFEVMFEVPRDRVGTVRTESGRDAAESRTGTTAVRLCRLGTHNRTQPEVGTHDEEDGLGIDTFGDVIRYRWQAAAAPAGDTQASSPRRSSPTSSAWTSSESAASLIVRTSPFRRLVVLAAIAGQTERIRLGSAVTVLSSDDPFASSSVSRRSTRYRTGRPR